MQSADRIRNLTEECKHDWAMPGMWPEGVSVQQHIFETSFCLLCGRLRWVPASDEVVLATGQVGEDDDDGGDGEKNL